MKPCADTTDSRFHGTTILAVKDKDRLVMAGDGQVTLGSTVIKHHARKVRRIYKDRILVGFAGATADALTLTEKLEEKLDRYNGSLTRAAVEMAREWRTDKYLRRLEALMLAADGDTVLLISGNGDVIEPDQAAVAIGSGGVAAQAAAMALLSETDLSARQIVERAMEIAGTLCIYTNDQITIDQIKIDELPIHAKNINASPEA